jgi:hypothetical protein
MTMMMKKETWIGNESIFCFIDESQLVPIINKNKNRQL